MTEMKDSVIAFVGPDESCASEALVAAAWNKALLSYVRNYLPQFTVKNF